MGARNACCGAGYTRDGGNLMETRIVHYQSTEQMQAGVAKLEAEGWVLQAVDSISEGTPGGETVRTEFVRTGDTIQQSAQGNQAEDGGSGDVSRQGA